MSADKLIEKAVEDATLIYEASVLAGIVKGGEILGKDETEEVILLLREMRAVTETHRLAVRIAAHFHVKMATEDRTLGDPVEVL